ncbi:hexameric tyrosine-coordinated heme protein [Povalibacter sp.]|uniref:hexameric tyrosine-coordinated heme protein n=1 Tax=Povalibacter sp. TaxID=1962978 RepID=UPI0032C22428
MHNVDLIPGDSLLTKTPDEGRQLAIAIARRVVKATQPDAATRERLREVYAGDAALLLQVCQIVATEFATIAAANGYWRTRHDEP